MPWCDRKRGCKRLGWSAMAVQIGGEVLYNGGKTHLNDAGMELEFNHLKYPLQDIHTHALGTQVFTYLLT